MSARRQCFGCNKYYTAKDDIERFCEACREECDCITSNITAKKMGNGSNPVIPAPLEECASVDGQPSFVERESDECE